MVDLNGADTSGLGVAVPYDKSHWGGGSVNVAEDLELQDLDDSSLVSAAVTLVNTPDDDAEFLQIETANTNISANYDATSGRLQLTGSESVANYERVLRSITYTNLQTQPRTADRRIRFVVFDQEGAGNTAVSRIVVIPKLVMIPFIRSADPALPGSDEPNNSCSQAYPLATDTAYQFFAEDKHDWYRFTIGTTTDLTVALTDYQPVEGQILVLIGPCDDLRRVGHNGDFSTSKPVQLTQLPAGTYYIWVITDNIRTEGDPFQYQLAIETP
jgi:hypothetical protein